MPDTLTIRPATLSDTGAVDALLAASYPRLLKPDYPASVLVTVIPLISRARPELMRCGTYFVAEAPDGAILGAGGWTPGDPRHGARNTGVGHIRHVVTDHRHTRKGIAAALMARVFETAADAGVRQLVCHSTCTAVPFYAAQGFREERPVDVPIGPAAIPFPAVLMKRAL